MSHHHHRRRRRRPLLLVVAAAAAAAVVLSGCSQGSAASGDPDVLTIFAPQDATNDLRDNSYTAEVEELLDTTIAWDTTTLDPSAAAQKRQTVIASGELPDVFMLISGVDQLKRPEVVKLGQQGALVPLQDLIAEHAPNIQAALEAEPRLAEVATAPDGTVWGLPFWNDCLHCTYPTKIWVNQEWLGAVGMDQPTTTDELREVLTAFKTRDPNGNGRADEVPLSGQAAQGLLIPALLNAFQYTPGPARPENTPLILKDGEVTFAATTDEYRQGLAYVSSLTADGLVDRGAFTQNADAFRALGDNADAVLVGAAATLHPANLSSLTLPDGRNYQYAATGPLTGPQGVAAATYIPPGVPGAVFAITTAASPEERVKAIRLADALYSSEGHVRAEIGLEGVDWERARPGDVALDPRLQPSFRVLPADAGASPGAVAHNDWGGIATTYSPSSYRDAQVQAVDTGTPEGYERRLWDATQPYVGAEGDSVFPGWRIWPPQERAAEIAEMQTNLQGAVAQSELMFITGQRDVTDDDDWQAHLDRLRSLGLEDYTDTMRSLYESPA